MSDLFFYGFFALCLWTFVKIIIDPKLVYEYPYFMGCMFIIFLLPQTVILKINPHLAPSNSLSSTFAMCFLCLLMVILGYKYAPSINVTKAINVKLNEKKIIITGIVYTFLGWMFLFLISINPDSKQHGNWSGILTIYYLLYQIINVGFPIFLFLAVKTRKVIYILFTFVAAWPTIQLIVFAGRREPTALFVLTIALTFFYLKNVKPSRILVTGGILLATLVTPIIGTYRAVADKDPALALATFDVKKNFIKYFEEGKDLELTVAAYSIDATSFFGSYDFGAAYWNEMVFRYVPAQFLGKDFKESLMIGKRGYDQFISGFVPLNGLTVTCAGDTFMHLGYLGCLFYFFLGGLMRQLWYAALHANILIKILYIMCMVQCLLSVSHGTINFLPGIFHTFIYLWLAALYAKEE